MKLLRRLFAVFQPDSPSSKLTESEANELISNLEIMVRKAVRSYKPPRSKHPDYAQAEYAAFIYFWLRTWHDQQDDSISEYDILDKLVMSWAQDGCVAVKLYDSVNYSNSWDRDRWFLDRVRLYQSIATTEPQEGSPPSLFVACHLLTALCSSNQSLDEFPDIDSSHQILKICLSQNIFGGAIEQLNLYTSATETMQTTLREITDILTKLHLSRVSH